MWDTILLKAVVYIMKNKVMGLKGHLCEVVPLETTGE